MAVLGRRGFVNGRDYRGDKVMAAVLPVPDSPWFMVSKMDAVEAFSEWRFRSGMILALLPGLLVLTGALLLTTWQQNRKAHYQAIYRSEARLRASEEQYRMLFENNPLLIF